MFYPCLSVFIGGFEILQVFLRQVLEMMQVQRREFAQLGVPVSEASVVSSAKV